MGVLAQVARTTTSIAKSPGLCSHGLVCSGRSPRHLFGHRRHCGESRELGSDSPSGPTFAAVLYVPTLREIRLGSHRGARPMEDAIPDFRRATEEHPEPAAAIVKRRG